MTSSSHRARSSWYFAEDGGGSGALPATVGALPAAGTGAGMRVTQVSTVLARIFVGGFGLAGSFDSGSGTGWGPTATAGAGIGRATVGPTRTGAGGPAGTGVV